MNTCLDEIIAKYGIEKLNTATKYPSILTYHNLGPKGSLVDSLVDDTGFGTQQIYVTEKVDGSNTRVVFFTDDIGCINDYFIGSREDVLHALGDRIINRSQHAVETVKSIADAIVEKSANHCECSLLPNSVYCLYGENYGGNINGYKQYTSHNLFDIRFFDLCIMDVEFMKTILDDDIGKISSWREHGGQNFVSVSCFNKFCEKFSLNRVPFIKEAAGSEIPETLQGAWDWLQQFSTSNAIIDNVFNMEYDGTKKAEGVVVRTEDRKLIRKLRFEDYEKTKRLGLIT